MNDYVYNNYRFIVDPFKYQGSSNNNQDNQNQKLQWNDILKVIVPSNKDSCPICLSKLISPRILLCGHLFCLHCLLQFLSNSINNKKVSNCPVCGDSFHIKSVKSVDIFKVESLISSVNLKLIRRPVNSSLALPPSPYFPSNLINSTSIPTGLIDDVFIFAKFILPTPNMLANFYKADLNNLLNELTIDDDQLTKVFIEKSIEYVLNSQSQLEILINDQSFNQLYETKLNLLNYINKRKPINYTPSSNTSDYFFYQSSQGLPFFLHPLDTRIMLHQFKSYSSFPLDLKVPIEHINECVMNNDIRKRCKYLSHLPQNSNFFFVEVNLNDVVDAQTIDHFKQPLQQRRQRRNLKYIHEERQSAKAARRQMKIDKDNLEKEAEALSSSSFPSFYNNSNNDYNNVDFEDEHSQLNHALALSAVEASQSQYPQLSFANALSNTSTSNLSSHQRIEDIQTFDAQWNEAFQSSNSNNNNNNNNDNNNSNNNNGKKNKKKKLVLGSVNSRRA